VLKRHGHLHCELFPKYPNESDVQTGFRIVSTPHLLTGEYWC